MAEFSGSLSMRTQRKQYASDLCWCLMMRNQKKKTFIVESKQEWKLWFLFILGVVELIVFILMISSIADPEYFVLTRYGIGELETRTVFLSLGLVFLYSLFFLIRCPRCHKRVIYKILKNSNFDEWFLAAVKMKHCPYCNYPD